MNKYYFGFTALFAVYLAWLHFQAPAAPPKPTAEREQWTTSHIHGSPEPPPPYKLVRAWENARFNHPTAITFAPGSDRVFVTEQEAKVFSLAGKADAVPELMIDLRKECKTLAKTPGAKKVDQLFGIVFHPKFAENRQCFLCYTVLGDKKNEHFPDGTRVSRFTVSKTDPRRLEPESEEVIIGYREGGHSGGCLLFGQDGCLYISTGDSGDPSPPDPLKTGQDNSDLLCCVLRIDIDHPSEGKAYSIPKDNPFIGQKQYDGKTICPEIWAFGLRNPWKMSFDRQTGELYVGDVGWELWEMIHKVTRGGNYGWSIVEASQPTNTTFPHGPGPIIPPVIELPHSQAASITGGYVYRGKKFPKLQGLYIFGDWETKRVWAAKIHDMQLDELKEIADPTIRVVAFGEDNAGELFIIDYDSGTIHTLAENAAVADDWRLFPRTLSATGLFDSVKDHNPAKGVYPFSIQAEQWQDGAKAERWVALPGDSFVIWNEKPKPIPGQVNWHNYKLHPPTDAVWVKTLSLETEMGNPATRRRVETQILHFNGEQFRGYSYRWREDQSDADLVPADGDDCDFDIIDKSVPNPKRRLQWSFADRGQCLQCHNAWAEGTLGFQLHQLKEDSLGQLCRLGMIRPYDRKDKQKEKPTAEALAKLPRMANLHGADSIQDRARAYLHANCGHCHRFGGGGSVQILLNWDLKNEDLHAINKKPEKGDFGLVSLIAAGNPEDSVLFYRMAKFGSGRMPHLGSEWPDPSGLRLISSWIASLDEENKKMYQLGKSPSLATACEALFEIQNWQDSELGRRTTILNKAIDLPPGPQRDLFEGYFPIEPGERKLGPNPKPQKILALKGDAEKGKELFFRESLQCMACHKIGDKGLSVGPELSKIGATRKRAELLESILLPSRRIEETFRVHIIQTSAGKTISGIPVKRTDKEVILKDAKNQETAVPFSEIESDRISDTSLMPDGLVRALTAQQAADLLEFLSTRK